MFFLTENIWNLRVIVTEYSRWLERAFIHSK